MHYACVYTMQLHVHALFKGMHYSSACTTYSRCMHFSNACNVQMRKYKSGTFFKKISLPFITDTTIVPQLKMSGIIETACP